MSVARDCLGCSKPSGETSTIQTHVRRSGGRVAVEALLYRTSVRRTYVQEEAMSAIAVPPSPRPVSRTQVRERTAEPAAEQTGVRRIGRAAGQVPPRPRLRLVTDDFVPEVPPCRAADVVARRPAAASALTMPAPSMRRPSRPAALRGRWAELEKLAPQHPAVRASRLREGWRSAGRGTRGLRRRPGPGASGTHRPFRCRSSSPPWRVPGRHRRDRAHLLRAHAGRPGGPDLSDLQRISRPGGREDNHHRGSSR